MLSNHDANFPELNILLEEQILKHNGRKINTYAISACTGK
jgi:hypothetical protein